jgi:hypothetical protein
MSLSFWIHQLCNIFITHAEALCIFQTNHIYEELQVALQVAYEVSTTEMAYDVMACMWII